MSFALRCASSCALLLAPALLAAGCAEPVPVHHEAIGEEELYTRCVLRAEGEKLYSSNYEVTRSGYKPGTEATITMFSAIRVDVRINNIPHKMYPTGGEFPTGDIDGFIEKYFVRDRAALGLDRPADGGDAADEQPSGAPEGGEGSEGAEEPADDWDWRLDRMRKGMRGNVEAGVATLGMTKEQVYMALGPPAEINFGQSALPLKLATIMDANRWVYYSNAITPWWFQRVYTFQDGELILVEQ